MLFRSPIFFADLGLDFSFRAFGQIDFMAVVLLVSVLTKLIAGWWGGRMIGMSNREAFGLGAVLNGRGVMELVVATIAYDRGFIGPTLFSVLVLMGVVTTVLSPVLLNAALGREARADYAARHRSPPGPQDR